MLCVPAVQVSHPLTARLPPEVQEAVGDGVVLKHDVVHMSVFLKREEEHRAEASSQPELRFDSPPQRQVVLQVCYLSVECDRTGLALGADALRPGEVALTA